MLALLAGEGLLLGVRYDSDSLRALPDGWWHLLRQAVPRAMPLTVAGVGLAGYLALTNLELMIVLVTAFLLSVAIKRMYGPIADSM